MRKITILLCLQVCIACLYAQTADTSLLKKRLTDYLQNNFQEKLYVHTDKNTYLAGEIIWFKIYNTEAYTNRPVNISKVAYIELLDNQNKPILQTKVTLKEGGGEGTFYLPVSINSGSYVLRTYTSWMKNFGADYYYHKDLSVYNTLKEENFNEEKKVDDNIYRVHFFPEGGNLVDGLTSRIAFRAVDQRGKSVEFEGVILNHNNDTISKFSPLKFGIGSFYFCPYKAEKYKVLIKPKGGNEFSTSLPPIFEKGTVISIKKTDPAYLSVLLQSNPVQQSAKYTLLVHTRQKIVYVKAISAEDIDNIHQIALSLLGDGISHFTLFNSEGTAICQRLYFKKPANLLNARTETDRQDYAPKEKVQLNIHAGLPVKTNYSISVYQTDWDMSEEESIISSLWLSSELKGKIENAVWYLKDPTGEATDNLMLTHGWRRFKWENIFGQEKHPVDYLPEAEGHIISGKLYNPLTGHATENGQVYLSVPSQQGQFYTSLSRKDGKFNFFIRDFYRGNEIIVQTDTRTDTLSQIEIHSPFSDKFSTWQAPQFNKQPQQQILLEKSIAMQVNNAYYSRQLNKEKPIQTQPRSFYNKPDKVYKLDDYVRFTTMEEVLREYVSEVTVALRKKDYYLRMLDNSTGQFSDKSPLVLIDGVPLFDEGNTIIKTNPGKIQRLELIPATYTYGRNTFSGIASFYSYKGDLAGYHLSERALVLDYESLQTNREFYSPMYEGDNAGFSRVPDYRTTLFWSGTNQTDANGHSIVSFFTSEVTGKYVVDIQLITADGKTGTARTTFGVKRK
ncbi:hypothetical protein [Pseudopedobacter sp.]|uniref:Plug domain-containing protein n=1 Tax=Pseudopedobacter sp. TaxID=1936787 RepID=UPI00333F182E